MNRRTFLKLTGATAVLAATPLSLAGKKEIPQWIRLTEQLPEVGQKVVMCCLGTEKTTAWHGRVAEVGVWGDNSVAYSVLKYEYYDTYRGKKIVGRCSPNTWNNQLCFFADRSSYRYWIPVEGEYPKTLPPFPSRASKWIDFKDMPPPSGEKIDVRDQDARIVNGWYVKSETGDYFVISEKYREWLNVNCIEVNKKMWSWRYI